MSHVNYSIALWGHKKTLLERVLLLQKRALRTILGLGYRESCRPHFKKTGLLTITAVYVYKCLILTASRNSLTRLGDTHSHNTRNQSRLAVPIHRTSKYEDQPIVTGIKLANHLPEGILLKPLNVLKKIIKNKLVEQPIYQIDEFYGIRFTT